MESLSIVASFFSKNFNIAAAPRSRGRGVAGKDGVAARRKISSEICVEIRFPDALIRPLIFPPHMDFQNLRYSPAVYRAALGCLFFNQGIIFASWASRIADVKTNLNRSRRNTFRATARTGLRDGAFRVSRHAFWQQNDGAHRRNILSRNARSFVSRGHADRAICDTHVLRSGGEPEQYIHKHAGSRGRVRLRALHYVVFPRAMEPRGILRRDFKRDARGKQCGAIPKFRGGFCLQCRGNARRAEFYPSGGH